MDSLDSNCLSVLSKNTRNHLFLFIGEVQVLAASWNSVIIGNWSNLGQWVLLDAVGSESSVDAGAEVFIVDHVLGIVLCLVFLSQRGEFLSGEVEVEHRKDLFELVFGHLASSELVKIEEELFNSDSLHDDSSLHTLLDIIGIVDGVHSLLHESVIDNVQVVSFITIEGLSSFSELTVHEHCVRFWVLSYVFWENILWLVNISTELEIVDFSNVSLVEVLPEQKLIHFFSWWDNLKFFENTSELLSGNMAALSSIVILELGLNKYTFVYNFSSD